VHPDVIARAVVRRKSLWEDVAPETRTQSEEEVTSVYSVLAPQVEGASDRDLSRIPVGTVMAMSLVFHNDEAKGHQSAIIVGDRIPVLANYLKLLHELSLAANRPAGNGWSRFMGTILELAQKLMRVSLRQGAEHKSGGAAGDAGGTA